ncbi:MAG TPA: SRPBCC family protein [Chloroflexota bacterium]|jgi:hypothetical protein|nr:SRPBCC family protein [Chloroflexota bacterium]
MFTVSLSLPVNDGLEPGQPHLTREQLWQALQLKVEKATLFVPGMSECQVVERGDNEVTREIVYRGDRRRQRVTFLHGQWVRFEHLSGPATGHVMNIIEEDERGRLQLRFTFEMEVNGLAPGSPEERGYADRMRDDYLAAIRGTLDAARKLQQAGQLTSA